VCGRCAAAAAKMQRKRSVCVWGLGLTCSREGCKGAAGGSDGDDAIFARRGGVGLFVCLCNGIRGECLVSNHVWLCVSALFFFPREVCDDECMMHDACHGWTTSQSPYTTHKQSYHTPA
jgi:hypothetical protein